MHLLLLIVATLGISLSNPAYSNEFALESPSFANNQKIPMLYTCNGENIPPTLNWSNAPENTQSFALIFYCPDSPMGTFYQWVLFNIPAKTTSIAQGGDNLPEGTLIGRNSSNEPNYSGPCPPDDLTYHYVFTLYALDTQLDLVEGADIRKVLAKIKYHTIKETQLTGLFNH